MKRVLFPVLSVIFILSVTACGGPTPAATQPPATETPVMQPSVTQPTATESPVTQPSATDTAPAMSGAQVIITLKDNTVTASQTTFQAGMTYTFVITNEGQHAHNFNINPPVSVVGSLDAALAQALLAVPREQLSVGASVTVDFTFPASAIGQSLEFSCLIKRHYEDEMFLQITVTQ